MSPRNRNRQLVTAVALLFISLIGLWGMGNAVFERVRSVDILRLLACGACLGIALSAFFQYLRGQGARPS
jgi:hypothetical protein